MSFSIPTSDATCGRDRGGGGETLLEYFECARQSPSGFFGFSGPNSALMHCAKGDVLAYFGVYDDERVLNSPVFAGGAMAVAKKPGAVELIRRWEQAYADDFELGTDSPSRIPNKPGFVRTGHDQSILSVACALYGAAWREKDRIVWPRSPEYSAPDMPHPIVAMRDKGIDNNPTLLPRPLKVLLGCVPHKPLRRKIGNWYKLRKHKKMGEELKRKLYGKQS